MRCVFCDADTEVLEVRHRADGSTRRTRRCYNTHRFTTLEDVYVANTGRKPAGGHALRAKMVSQDERHLLIEADLARGLSVLRVCERYGISPRTVARVRAAMKARAPPARPA